MMAAMDTSTTGMHAMQFLLDTTANNLANLNTVGFKYNTVRFQDLFYFYAIPPGGGLVQGVPTPTGLSVGFGVAVASNVKVFTQGPLQSTGLTLDVAIQGEGFFQFTAADGSLVYSRDGALQINSLGQLINGSGFPLSPAITLPPNILSIQIATNGVVSVITSSSPTPVTVGSIRLARFANPAGLVAVGDNLFRASAAAGSAVVGIPSEDGFGTTEQFFLEQSNVDVASELVNLLVAQRAFEFNARVITVTDEMLQETADLIG